MAAESFHKMDRQGLEKRMEREKPDNEHRSEGYALVNVLPREEFEKEHIRHSINIPVDDAGEFENRFDKNKEIVVYCASFDCDASPKAAEELIKRDFEKVYDYEGGLKDWKEAGDPVEGKKAA